MSVDPTPWPGPDKGALFVVTGASGTGKTTLVKAALQAIPSIGWSVSATTRPPREGEVDGRDYHFVSHADFDALVADAALLEWAAVYGNRYGTPRAPVAAALDAGRSILRADGIGNMDLSFLKNTKTSEKTILQFRADFFNLTNTRNFGVPDGRVNSAAFLNQWNTDGGRRRIQLSARFQF